MRFLRYPAAALVVALAATGIAIAATPSATTKQVAATFSTTPKHVNTKTCTGADGTYVITDGVYTGTATGTLTGGAADTLKIHAKTVVNQTTGDGTAKGHFSIKNGTAPVANGSLYAVVSGVSSLNGLMVGRGPGAPPPPPRHLVANFTATVSAGGMSGQIGGNGSMANGAVTQGGPCPVPQHPHPHHAHVHPVPPHPGPPHNSEQH